MLIGLGRGKPPKRHRSVFRCFFCLSLLFNKGGSLEIDETFFLGIYDLRLQKNWERCFFGGEDGVSTMNTT